MESEWQQVFRTLLSIIAVLNNAVYTRPPTSKSSGSFSNPLVTVPNAPITIGIIVTCVSHFLGRILVCAYTISQHGQILILVNFKNGPSYLTWDTVQFVILFKSYLL